MTKKTSQKYNKKNLKHRKKSQIFGEGARQSTRIEADLEGVEGNGK